MSQVIGHVPVLSAECIQLLRPRPGAHFVDCTVDGGGHSVAILERTGPGGQLLGIDADPAAVALARQQLAPYGDRVTLIQGNFRDLGAIAAQARVEQTDGILMDLGMSSVQLGAPSRGFSFWQEGPLDMRYDPTSGETAADLLALASEHSIEQLLRAFGEEPQAKRIASAIVAHRRSQPLQTTTQLAELVSRAGGRRRRIHAATRTFQALRIAVNDELNALSEAIPQAVALLRRGARLAVISFHSLEDRIVKTLFLRLAGREPAPRLPVPRAPSPSQIQIVTRRPITPSLEERAANPRSRSARLRVAERV